MAWIPSNMGHGLLLLQPSFDSRHCLVGRLSSPVQTQWFASVILISSNTDHRMPTSVQYVLSAFFIMEVN